MGRTNHLLSFETTRTAYKTRGTILLALCVFVTRGNVFTKPLTSNDRTVHIVTKADVSDL
jgi:hypothetical protein